MLAGHQAGEQSQHRGSRAKILECVDRLLNRRGDDLLPPLPLHLHQVLPVLPDQVVSLLRTRWGLSGSGHVLLRQRRQTLHVRMRRVSALLHHLTLFRRHLAPLLPQGRPDVSLRLGRQHRRVFVRGEPLVRDCRAGIIGHKHRLRIVRIPAMQVSDIRLPDALIDLRVQQQLRHLLPHRRVVRISAGRQIGDGGCRHDLKSANSALRPNIGIARAFTLQDDVGERANVGTGGGRWRGRGLLRLWRALRRWALRLRLRPGFWREAGMRPATAAEYIGDAR